jgi:hypothetical protein
VLVVCCALPATGHAGLLDDLTGGIMGLAAKAGLYDPRFDDFKRLVDAGNVDEALKLRADNLQYFNAELPDDKQAFAYQVFENRLLKQLNELLEDGAPAAAWSLYLQALAQEPVACTPMNQALCERIFAALAADQAQATDKALSKLEGWAQTPADASNWVPLKRGLQRLSAQIKADSGHRLPPVVSDTLQKAQLRLDAITATLQGAALQALRQYGFAQTPPFAEVYPAEMDMRLLVSGLPLDGIDGWNIEAMRSLQKGYGPYLNAAQKSQLAVAFMRKVHKERRPGYFSGKAALEQARSEGFDVSDQDWPVAAWHFADLDKLIILNMAASPGVVLRPAANGAKPADLANGVKSEKNGLLVFTVSGTETSSREEKGSTRYTSASLAGSQRVRNPAYDEAVNRVNKARSDLALAKQQAQNLSGANTAITFLALTSQSLSESALAEAEQTLATTPRQIDQDVKDNYEFLVKRTVLTKRKPVTYLVIDPETARRCEGQTELLVNREFQLVVGIRPNDVNIKDPSQRGWVNELTAEGYARKADSQPYGALLTKVVDACKERL